MILPPTRRVCCAPFVANKINLWTLGQTAEGAHKAPSAFFTDPPLDDWTAYQLDRAVIMFCNAIKNALMETVMVGDERKPRWALKDLLAEGFTMPRDGEGTPMAVPLTRTDGVVYDEVR